MREVTRDDKWNEETDGRMKNVQQDMSDSMDNLEADLISAGPTEADLVTVALLMRLYDLGMAILSHLDKDEADKLYEAHENGGTFNPPVYIPQFGDDDEEDSE